MKNCQSQHLYIYMYIYITVVVVADEEGGTVQKDGGGEKSVFFFHRFTLK